jgi:hypothetical protein
LKCAVCARQAKGYGWFNPHLKRSDPARYSDHWVFCSRRCQNAFSTLMNKTQGHMINPSDMESTAMGACLQPLGEFVGMIGMDRPLASYSRMEVLSLIEVVVTAYQGQMTAEHERMAARDRSFLPERLRLQRGRV